MEFQAQMQGLMAVAAGQEKAVPVSMGRLRRRRHMGPQRRRWGIRGRWRARREPPTRPTRGASAAAGPVPAVTVERTELQPLVPARCAAQRRASALCEVCEDPTNKFVAMLRLLSASSKLPMFHYSYLFTYPIYILSYIKPIYNILYYDINYSYPIYL